MKEIPLTRGLVALVDDEDYKLVSSFKWSASKHGRNWYAIASVNSCGKRETFSMHRFLCGWPEGVDHRDGNGLNNQRHNLRPAGQRQNQRNRLKTASASTSQYKGVSWKKKPKRWLARISVYGEIKWLGRFKDEIAAARAYDAAARELFGEFAALNFPLPGERSALTGEIVPLEVSANDPKKESA
jgi:hypothetical protein